jgi:ectoine hydroxylase-related dioxygenase (phytanoyl-CoA dioxygenase family)
MNKEYELKKDGFFICKNVLNDKEIMYLRELCKKEEYQKIQQYLLQNEGMKQLIKNYAGSQYQFQDYIWIIKKSAVHTCHRDNNGDFFNEGQQWPSYTMLVYLEDMEKCLGVIPESHREPSSYFVDFKGSLTDLLCGRGDIILFNANLIHVGTINNKEDNLRIQLKITHKDDIQHIKYYENFHKVLNQDNQLPQYVRKIQRNLSCIFPGISNMTQSENIRSARGSDNGANIGQGQKWFSYLFYGNSDFYDLPNAF